MHPKIGPKLRSGDWLNLEAEGLPPIVREAMAEAISSGPIQGIDYNIKSSSSSSPLGDAAMPDWGRGPSVVRPPGKPPKAASRKVKGREFWKRKAAEALVRPQGKPQDSAGH